MPKDLKQLIKESGFQEVHKIIDYVTNKTDEFTKKQIRAMIPQVIVKDIRGVVKKQRKFFNVVVGRVRGSFQMDLLQQTGKNSAKYPAFFLIAINVNTKKLYAEPIAHKSTAEVLKALQKVYLEAGQNINMITTDQERAFESKDVRDWAESNEIVMKSLNSEKHTSLSVVDRVIRTLRDMGAKKIAAENTRELRDFSREKMARLVETYNNTPHDSLKKPTGGHMKPNAMDNDPHAEKEFIIDKLMEQQNRQDSTKDYKLQVGKWARFIMPRGTMRKHRYAVSPQVAKIICDKGSSYILQAADKSTHEFSRWRLIPASQRLEHIQSFPQFK
jgi:hypothetical protein